MSHVNRIFCTIVSASLLLSCAVYANKPASTPGGQNAAKGKPFNEQTTIAPGAKPPGLKHDPYGLMKQGKTPPGWTKGIKKGWRCNKTRAGNAQVCVDSLNHKKACHLVNDMWFCQK